MTSDPLQRHSVRPELEASFPYCAAVRHGDLLFVSGCVAWNNQGEIQARGDMAAQTRLVYGEIQQILEAHGATMRHVIKENAYTMDMKASLAQSMPVRATFYEGTKGPASTWVQIGALAADGALLEVEVVAKLPA